MEQASSLLRSLPLPLSLPLPRPLPLPLPLIAVPGSHGSGLPIALSLQPHRNDLRHPRLLHGHAVEQIGALHGAAVVGDHDELGVLGHGLDEIGEPLDVGVVERGVDLVEDAERRRFDPEQRDEQRRAR